MSLKVSSFLVYTPSLHLEIYLIVSSFEKEIDSIITEPTRDFFFRVNYLVKWSVWCSYIFQYGSWSDSYDISAFIQCQHWGRAFLQFWHLLNLSRDFWGRIGRWDCFFEREIAVSLLCIRSTGAWCKAFWCNSLQ